MKFSQRLELSAGAATLIVALIFFYMDVWHDLKLALNEQESVTKILLVGLLLYILPALLTFLGAFFYAFREKVFGLVTLTIGGIGSVLVSMLLLLQTLVAHHRYGWSGSLLALLFGAFAVFTVYFAFRSKKDFSPAGLPKLI